METLPPEGTPVTIKDGWRSNGIYLGIVKEWVPSVNKETNQIECHHAIITTIRGNYEELVRIERIKSPPHISLDIETPPW